MKLKYELPIEKCEEITPVTVYYLHKAHQPELGRVY